MAKPTIVTRAGKGSALTWTEGDTNLTNLRDATITVTGDSGTITNDLNGSFKISGGVGMTSAASGTTLTLDLDSTTVTAGSYTNASITVDAQGRLTAASSGSTPVTSVSGIAGRITSSGGTTPIIDLASSIVTPGTYNYATVTLDTYGRVTGATSSSTTGSGNVVLATSPSISSPSLTTPSLGVATATTINKVTITAPATSATLTIADGKTVTVNNTMTLAGTDSTTLTMPDVTGKLGFLNLPAVGTKTSSYTLATGDVGKYVQVGSGGSITIPNSTFAEGDVVVIVNNHSAAITITCSITDAYIAGTDTDKATVSLATRGLCSVVFLSATRCILTGNVS